MKSAAVSALISTSVSEGEREAGKGSQMDDNLETPVFPKQGPKGRDADRENSQAKGQTEFMDASD